MTPLILARALSFAGSAAMLGVPLFAAVILLPGIGGRSAAAKTLGAALASRLRRLCWGAAALTLLAGLAWLALQAGEMSGASLGAVLRTGVGAKVLGETQFGATLILRGAAILLFALALAATARGVAGGFLAASAFAAVALAAIAWAGHAAGTGGAPGFLHRVCDAAHLLAAGAWLGGLLALALLLKAIGRAPPPDLLALAAVAARRFSPLGIACVATLLASGLVNCWFLVGDVPRLVGTPYGQLLLAKVALFLLMVGIAAVNRRRLTPALAGRRADATRAVAALRRNCLVEAALGGLVLVLVGAIGELPPGVHEQPWWPFPWRPSAEAMKLASVQDDITIAVAMVVAGIALVIAGLRRWRGRLLAIAAGLTLMASFAPTFGLLMVAAYPTSFITSPAAYTTQSIARGGRLYAEYCVACHGAHGKGDGRAASILKVPPADLTASHVLDHSEGDMFWWLTAGIRESFMPGFADILSENDRWDLINWVRTLPVGGLDEGLVTEVGEGPAPRAPDFTFEAADGEEASLRDALKGGPLLLVLYTPSSAARLQRLAAAEKTLADAGLRILALPLTDGGGPSSAPLPHFVATADASVAAAYRVIAAPPGYAPRKPASHLEFLIDGNGYARALWQPEQTIAWDDVRSLVNLVGQLARRPLAPGSAPVHAHPQ